MIALVCYTMKLPVRGVPLAWETPKPSEIMDQHGKASSPALLPIRGRGGGGRSLSEFYTDLDVKINFVLACVSLPIDISRLFLYPLGIIVY